MGAVMGSAKSALIKAGKHAVPRALAWALLAAAPAQVAAADTAEQREQLRARIQAERERIEARFSADMAACQQRFAVTACADEASQRRREALAGPRAQARRERQAEIEATQERIRARQADRLRDGKVAAPLPVPAASR